MAASQRLAIHGGPPAFPEGPPPWPQQDDDVRQALRAVYASGDWGRYRGAHGEALADELAQFHRVEHVTLCCSGTIAVELALRGLGIGPGDEVVLAGYDFPGNFRAIEAAGGRPVLADVDAGNWCLDPAQVAAACSDATKGLIVSHLHGGMAPMRELMDTARQLGLAVVEDACQCPGAVIQGRWAGTWGDAGVLSFGGSKLLTAGRGGAVLTPDAAIHQRIKIFSERGNLAFPLSELQAAVLRPQLQKLPQRNALRLENARRLTDALAGVPGVRPVRNRAEGQAGYYKFGLEYVSGELGGRSREEYLAAVQAEGIALHAGFRGFVRRGPRRCRTAGTLVHAQQAAESALVLHHPVLLGPAETIDRLAAALAKVAAGLR